MYTQEMKKSDKFLQSLEQYIYKTAGRSPLPWPWIGMGVVGIALLLSLLNVKNSVAGAQNTRELIVRASARGDYEKARELLTAQQTNELTSKGVLGVESELEDKVYPEKVVERKIVELEDRLEQYPNHFEIIQELSRLNSLVGNTDKSSEYREKARILDPNNQVFQ